MDELQEEIKEYGNKVRLVIRIIALIAALSLLLTLWFVPKTNCDACSFDGQSAEEFMGEYNEECIEREINIINLSISSQDNS